MPIVSFREWLATRSDEAPAAENLATIIAIAGAAGISLDRLNRLCGLSAETLADVLKALVASGQVTVLKVGGQIVYRAAM
jgi:predicted transcriptional regulator